MKKDYSSLCMWTMSKLAGKKQNVSSTWKTLMKDVDLGDPTSFLDHISLGCTQRECPTSKDIVDNYRSMFESRISAGATEKLPTTKATRKPDAETISSWSYDKESHPKGSSMRKWISSRIIFCLLTICSKMPTLGTYWKA